VVHPTDVVIHDGDDPYFVVAADKGTATFSDVANRDAWLAEGTESYRVFIRALLSITDNIVEGAVVHPTDVVIHDGDDPYFVVAADKGTATFSDVAN
ncbi:NAD-glutamate dehydrogenase domain-containing protein, partial [Chryseobacterium sp. CH25]|uniref:NAD-glutamate dehydrogenase domain-containing protein n=1 Tax=Chryseobacterium sp. CH25 TaxID=713559 RepID=UPI0013E97A9B